MGPQGARSKIGFPEFKEDRLVETKRRGPVRGLIPLSFLSSLVELRVSLKGGFSSCRLASRFLGVSAKFYGCECNLLEERDAASFGS